MYQSRRRRLYDTAHSQQDQPAVDADDPSVVPVYPFHQLDTDLLEHYYLTKIIRSDRDICDLSCDLGAVAYRDAYVRS